MTSQARRKGLLPPRRPRTVTTYGVDPVVGTNPAEVLDNTYQEIGAGSPADAWRSIVPTGFPGWQHSKSSVIQRCLILIEKGLRGVPLEDVQIQLLEGLSPDLAELAELAELTAVETDVLALAGNGWKQRDIAGWLDIGQATVSRRLRSGRGKLADRLPPAVAHSLNTVLLS